MRKVRESGQTTELDSYHRDKDEGGGALLGGFVVTCQATLTHQPADGPFDHPTPGQHLKSLSGVAAFDHFDLQLGPNGLHPLGEGLPAIPAIDPQLAQPIEPGRHVGEQVAGALSSATSHGDLDRWWRRPESTLRLGGFDGVLDYVRIIAVRN